MASLGIRTRIGLLATIVTVWLLSIFGTVGYLTAIEAARQSQTDQLSERLNMVERELAADGPRLVSQLELDTRVRVVREGETAPLAEEGTVLVSRPSDVEGVDSIVGIASTRQIDDAFDTIRRGMWISILAISLIVGGVAWAVVDRSLRPVRRLTKQARAIEGDSTAQLLPVEGAGDELSELAKTFNDMISRLRSADVDRRRFVSDASHELRTPLMVLSADAEHALAHPADGDTSQQLGSSVLKQTDRLTALVDDLLMLAAIDEGRPVTDRTSQVAVVLADADAYPLIVGDVPAVSIPDISRSIGNLVANANRHCRDRVEVRTVLDASTALVTFTVDDDGAGVPESARELVFRRFARLENSRSREADHRGGAGLGLAIARAEVNRVGGTIAVGDSPLGGARFMVTVPVIAGTDD